MHTHARGAVAAYYAALALVVFGAFTLLGGTQPAHAAVGTVTVAGQTHQLDGVNVYRSANFLVQYTPAFGASTQTNPYGFEAAVVNGTVTQVQNGVGDMAIPSNGYVLSGHGTSRTWLQTYAKVGAPVTVSTGGGGGGGGGSQKLPDLGIRNLNNCAHPPCFKIVNSGTVKELKFDAVMANVGYGPFEIHGTRSSSTSTDWVGTQTIYSTDGTKTSVTTPGVSFFYAGDGHNHWHVRALQKYKIFDSNGVLLDRGTQAKQGFCFEDNTDYRDWPSTGRNGAPASEVYTEATDCAPGNPSATSLMEGLSVGWGDTYPSTLPDQYIDITGLPDGTYTVKVVADWANWYKEVNDSNNTATAQIKITGNTVTVVSTTDGL